MLKYKGPKMNDIIIEDISEESLEKLKRYREKLDKLQEKLAYLKKMPKDEDVTRLMDSIIKRRREIRKAINEIGVGSDIRKIAQATKTEPDQIEELPKDEVEDEDEIEDEVEDEVEDEDYKTEEEAEIEYEKAQAREDDEEFDDEEFERETETEEVPELEDEIATLKSMQHIDDEIASEMDREEKEIYGILNNHDFFNTQAIMRELEKEMEPA